MRGLLDVDNHGEEIVRHGAQSSIIANDIQLTILQVWIQLSIIRSLQTLSTLKDQTQSSRSSLDLFDSHSEFIEIFGFIDGHMHLHWSTSEFFRSGFEHR